MQDHLPIILIELVLVLGGTLGFGWWQLRSVKRDREALAARRRAEAEAEAREQARSGNAASASPAEAVPQDAATTPHAATRPQP